MEELFINGVSPGKFVRFVVPTIVMMVMMSIFYMIDGIIIANCLGVNALAVINIVYPVQGILIGFSVMLALGASTIAAIRLGEGKKQEANEAFSLIYWFSVGASFFFTFAVLLFMNPLVHAMGATELLMDDCKTFLFISTLSTPFFFVAVLYEFFIRVDGNPGFTLILYTLGGVVHICLGLLFMVVLDWGIEGAAWAGCARQFVTFLLGTYYFVSRDTQIRFVRPKWNWEFIINTIINGSSEMVTQCSASVAVLVYNLVAIKFAGESGVASLAIVMSIYSLIVSIFLGYISGVSPLISYYFGAKKFEIVNEFVRYSRYFTITVSVTVALFTYFGAWLLVRIYESPGTSVFDYSLIGMKYLAVVVLLAGVNIYSSGFFTSFGNGPVSAAISFTRGLIGVIIGAAVFPVFLGLEGIWASMIFSDVIALGITSYMFRKYRDVYHYRIFSSKGFPLPGLAEGP